MGEIANVHRLDRISAEKLKSLDPSRAVVGVAISPLEVHGPHLPIGQDLLEAQALLEKTLEAVAVEKPDWNFVIAPPIPVSIECVPHMGSVPFPMSVVRDVAYYSMRPFARHGFARIVYSSFHGSPRHIIALEDAARRLTKKYDTAAASIFSAVISRMADGNMFYDAVRDLTGTDLTLDQMAKDTHAGFIETSLALRLWPELVDPGWEGLPPQTKAPEDGEGGGFLFGGDAAGLAEKLKKAENLIREMALAYRHFKTNTYSGYPAKASAEAGRLMIERLVGIAKDLMLEFVEKGEKMDCHSPLWKFKDIFLNPALNHVVDNWLKINQE